MLKLPRSHRGFFAQVFDVSFICREYSRHFPVAGQLQYF
jgi:hypothetical protein